jgi:hypothetical protein
MNQVNAVIVRAAEVMGAYWDSYFKYGIDNCCECQTKVSKLVIAHFLLSNTDCTIDTTCIKIPDLDEVEDIEDYTGITTIDCTISITEEPAPSCSDLTITV